MDIKRCLCRVCSVYEGFVCPSVTSGKGRFYHEAKYRTVYIVFFLIKPTHALISQIYFCQETLHYFGQFLCPSSGVFHCIFGTGICHAGLKTTSKHDHPSRAWKLSSNLHDIYQCRIYSGKLLMMGRGTARNM